MCWNAGMKGAFRHEQIQVWCVTRSSQGVAALPEEAAAAAAAAPAPDAPAADAAAAAVPAHRIQLQIVKFRSTRLQF